MNINITNITSAAVFHFASLIIFDELLQIKKLSEKNIGKEMDSKTCSIRNIAKKDDFYKLYRM